MSAATDRTPLLPTSNGNSSPNGRSASPKPQTALQKFAELIKAEDGPSYTASLRYFLFGSWLNILLVFVPLSYCSHVFNWDAGLRFLFSFIAIMPLAALLGTCTDQLSLKLGETLSGLLNATFGNAVEIIVGIAALLQGELRIVQTSLLGSILSNLLLVLGCSFLAGGLVYDESNFQVTAAQASSSLMTLTCITLVIPAAYHSAKSHAGGIDEVIHILPFPSGPIGAESFTQVVDGSDLDDRSNQGLRIISRGTAILLLLVYVAFLIFQLRTHSYLYSYEAEVERADRLGLARPAARRQPEPEEPDMNPVAAGLGLLAATIVTSFCADYLVASIEETAERYHIPRAFIGLILLPIVANAAEHVTSVWMAMKDKMELTIGICVGSSIQIAAFVIPLLVIVGWA
ncbi:hypothetical protein EIP86_010802 [Pleurotus ostreatoroseus]|nr:hypothetical protein EIP86_010802 [Pleurotus ostreatoroseus]